MLATISSETMQLLKACMLVLTACGAFIVGINMMSKGFVRLASKENSLFYRMFRTKNRVGGMLSGFLHSALTQSSDATSVFVIRLSDVGSITLFQACCAIIGANIGTTVTNFIVSMSEFNVAPYFAFCAFLGAFPLLIGKGGFKTFGEIVSGFGIMFIGIQLLELNSQNPAFTNALSQLIDMCKNPLIILLVGFGITAIVQSSSVVTSLVIFLIGVTTLSMEGAFYLVVGANVGTCVTSFIASAKSSINAKRSSLFHVMFNVLGAIIFIVLMHYLSAQIMGFWNSWNIPPKFKVSFFSLMFNFGTAIVVLIFARPLVALTRFLIRSR